MTITPSRPTPPLSFARATVFRQGAVIRRGLVAAGLFALAACATDGSGAGGRGAGGGDPGRGVEGPSPTAAACPAPQLQDRLGGRLIASAAAPPADGSPFLRVSDLPQPHRILFPGSLPATATPDPRRLTIVIDAGNRIAALSCE